MGRSSVRPVSGGGHRTLFDAGVSLMPDVVWHPTWTDTGRCSALNDRLGGTRSDA